MDLQAIENFAAEKHKGQTYGGTHYTYHLKKVVERVMVSPRCSEDLIAAAWLHDVLEDTDATPEEILAISNQRVLTLVQLLTDKQGKNRRERHEATYPLIALDPDAVVIKLADRFANLSSGLITDDISKLKMYRKEQEYFRSIFFDPANPEIVKTFEILDDILSVV